MLTLPATGSAGSIAGQHAIVVDGVAPTVTSVGVPASGTYVAGQALDFTLNFSEAVTVDTTGGTPRIAVALDTGGTAYADYVSGSGSTALVFRLTVADGQLDANGLTLAGSVDSHGGTLRDAVGNAALATLNGLPSTAGVHVDAVAPTPGAIVRGGSTPTNAGSVAYTVSFGEDVSGVDAADFTLTTTGSAGGGITSVTQVDAHTYTVTIGGVSGTGTLRLDLNASGTGIVDAAGNALAGGLAGSAYAVDRDAPVVTSVGVPASGTYGAGQALDFTVSFSEAVTVDTAGGTPRIAVTLDTGGTVYADYVSGSGSTALVFRLTVADGQLDANGLTLAGSVDSHGGTLRDAVGNAAAATLDGVPATEGVRIDAAAPQLTAIDRDGPALTAAGQVSYTLHFSEAVTGLDTGDFSLLTTGNASGRVERVTQVDALTWRVEVGQLSGQGQVALRLAGLGSGIADAAGNGLAAGADAPAYQVVPPVVVPPVAPPPAPEAAPPFVPAPVPWTAPHTFSPLAPVNQVDTPTLRPAAAPAALPGVTPAPIVALEPQGLAASLPASTPPAAARPSFIETGAGNGPGLRSVPDLGNYTTRGGQPLEIVLPASTFTHGERGESISVEVRLSDGRPLPAWLKFDPATGRLSGQPPAGLVQRLEIEVIARDGKGQRASTHLSVEVRPGDRGAAPTPPAGRPALAAQFERHGSAARQTERAALLHHLNAASRQG